MGVAQQQHNNGRVGGAGKRMRAVDGKQEINLEWPNCSLKSSQNCLHGSFSKLKVLPLTSRGGGGGGDGIVWSRDSRGLRFPSSK